jgi:hypothetical protein
MTGATAVCEEHVRVERERRPCAGPRGVTIGQLLARAHEAAHAGRAADCPVCGGSLSKAGPAAHCGDCGTRLA